MTLSKTDVPMLNGLLKTKKGRYFLTINGDERYSNMTADEIILFLLEGLTGTEFVPKELTMEADKGWAQHWVKP